MSSDQPQPQPAPTVAAPAAAPSSAPAAAVASPAPWHRRPLAIGGIAVGIVVLLGLTFGGGVATGWAISSAQSPASFSPGEMPGGGPQMGEGGGRPDQGTLPTRPDEQSSDDTGSTDDDS